MRIGRWRAHIPVSIMTDIVNPDDAHYFMITERLGFRRWREDDIELVMAIWGDPEVTALTGGAATPEQARERLRREIANDRAFGVQYWPIFLRSTGEHVGCCGLRPHKLGAQTFELGYYLKKRYWGMGFASEAARAAAAYALGKLGVATLVAGHNPANDGSRRVLEKIGFRYTHHELYEPTGLDHPNYILTSAHFADAAG